MIPTKNFDFFKFRMAQSRETQLIYSTGLHHSPNKLRKLERHFSKSSIETLTKFLKLLESADSAIFTSLFSIASYENLLELLELLWDKEDFTSGKYHRISKIFLNYWNILFLVIYRKINGLK